MPEILLILAIALIVIGPKKLPDLAKGLGKALGEFKRATNELKTSMDIDPGLKDVKSAFDEMNEDIKGAIHSDPISAQKDEKNLDTADSAEDKASDEHVIAEDPEDGSGGFNNLKQAFDEINTKQEDTPTETDKGSDADTGKASKTVSASEKEKSESVSHGH